MQLLPRLPLDPESVQEAPEGRNIMKKVDYKRKLENNLKVESFLLQMRHNKTIDIMGNIIDSPPEVGLYLYSK